MAGFVVGMDRGQATPLPECLEDWVDESNPTRVIDAFVDAPDLRKLGFEGMDPAETGRPAYHPSAHLKLYIYGSPGVHIPGFDIFTRRGRRRAHIAIPVS
jgi:hypothetical protein